MSPQPVRRISALLLRLGVAGLFLVALAATLTGFALFGCANCPPTGESRPTEGFIINPPDPPAKATQK